MATGELVSPAPLLRMRSYIQRVATGPEYSKEISFDEARDGMKLILQGEVDPVQSALFLIGLRLKRESDDEYRGILQALIDASERIVADCDEVIDIADPYDGYTRSLPASPFLPAVLAGCGQPAFSHGADTIGPKYGVTHRKVLEAAGIDVELGVREAAGCLSDPALGWAYVDQRQLCKPLHDLVELRSLMVKRPAITTVEVLLHPLSGRERTHLVTGYVHKTYPRIYSMLARYAGFDSAMIVRGVEGGVTPSLQSASRFTRYHGDEDEESITIDPATIGRAGSERALPLPADLPSPEVTGDGIPRQINTPAAAAQTAAMGLAALRGEPGPMLESLVYSAGRILFHLKRFPDSKSASEFVAKKLQSGAVLQHFQAGLIDYGPSE